MPATNKAKISSFTGRCERLLNSSKSSEESPERMAKRTC